jgi:hypothetical protein
MSYLELARKILGLNPDILLFVNKGHDALGYWSHSAGKVRVLACLLTTGDWARIEDFRANGEPVWKQEDWAPMTYEGM